MPRLRFARVVACVVLVVLVCRPWTVRLGAEPPDTPPGVKTDRGVYPEPALPELPPAGGIVVDPTFGTALLRLTDAADGKSCHNAYSYYPSFNKTSTRLFVCCDGQPVLFRFDPDAFRLLGKEPLFARNPPSGHAPRWEDVIWSGAEADVLYGHEGLNLWRYDVAAREFSLVRSFDGLVPPGHLTQMSKSLDDNVFAFSLQDPKWRLAGFLAWKRDEDKILLQQGLPPEGLDEVQVDKTGRFLLIKTAGQGRGVIQARVADLRTGRIEDLTDDAPDFAPGHSDNGRGTVLGAENWQNRLLIRRLDRPHEFVTVLEMHNDWSQGCHVSTLADDEAWALVSFYAANELPSPGVFRNEIVLAATDGSQRVRRLAHHRSVVKEYWDSPRACISRDGRFVVFTSNWGGSPRRDAFVLRVLPAPGGNPPAPASR